MVTNLKEFCGLDIKLDTAQVKLQFGAGLTAPEPAVRSMDEMREVIFDKNIGEPRELYFMYRDVHALADKPLLDENKLRYDVTVIKPDRLGREFMKTAGHYHPGSFGELYEVVFGRCYCLLQRPDPSNHKVIKEVILVEASVGQKIVIPPGFGHILVNPGPQILVTSNWVSGMFSSEYDLYKKAGGASHFVMQAKDKPEIIPNPYFIKNSVVRWVSPSPRIEKFGLIEGQPMYPLIKTGAQKLRFLNNPLDFEYNDVFVEKSPAKSVRSCCRKN